MQAITDFVKSILAAAPQYKKFASYALGIASFVVANNLVSGTALHYVELAIGFLAAVGIVKASNAPYVPFAAVRASVKNPSTATIIGNENPPVDEATQAAAAASLGLKKQ